MNNDPVKLLSELSETAAATIKHAIKSGVIIAKEEKVTERINICIQCPDLDKTSARCSWCGCYMNTKVRFDAAKCPIHKW